MGGLPGKNVSLGGVTRLEGKEKKTAMIVKGGGKVSYEVSAHPLRNFCQKKVLPEKKKGAKGGGRVVRVWALREERSEGRGEKRRFTLKRDVTMRKRG